MAPDIRQARRLLLENLPAIELRPQPVSDWTGDFDLPSTVMEYYHQIGPVDFTIEGYGNPWFLPSLAALWEFQAGYRFHPTSRQRFEDWSDDWLVIADQGADPFIFSRASEEIFYDWHGQGVWNPAPLCRDLATMISSFAILGGIAAREGSNLCYEQAGLKEIFTREAAEKLAAFVGDRDEALKILERLGWESLA